MDTPCDTYDYLGGFIFFCITNILSYLFFEESEYIDIYQYDQQEACISDKVKCALGNKRAFFAKVGHVVNQIKHAR